MKQRRGYLSSETKAWEGRISHPHFLFRQFTEKRFHLSGCHCFSCCGGRVVLRCIFNLPRYRQDRFLFCKRCETMSYIGNGWCQTCGHRSRPWRGHPGWGARKAAGMGKNRGQRRDAHGRQGRRGGEERRDKPPAPSPPTPTGAAPPGTPPPSPEVVIVETPGHRVV